MQPKEVFLSHSDLDREFVSHLAEVLAQHGIPLWYSQTNIVGAKQWHDEIGSALSRCDWFAIVLSPNSVDSIWVKRELLYALQQKRLVDKIVPILLKSCAYEELSWTLPIYQFVDFSKSFNQGCRDLLRIWGIGLRGKKSSKKK